MVGVRGRPAKEETNGKTRDEGDEITGKNKVQNREKQIKQRQDGGREERMLEREGERKKDRRNTNTARTRRRKKEEGSGIRREDLKEGNDEEVAR